MGTRFHLDGSVGDKREIVALVCVCSAPVRALFVYIFYDRRLGLFIGRSFWILSGWRLLAAFSFRGLLFRVRFHYWGFFVVSTPVAEVSVWVPDSGGPTVVRLSLPAGTLEVSGCPQAAANRDTAQTAIMNSFFMILYLKRGFKITIHKPFHEDVGKDFLRIRKDKILY